MLFGIEYTYSTLSLKMNYFHFLFLVTLIIFCDLCAATADTTAMSVSESQRYWLVTLISRFLNWTAPIPSNQWIKLNIFEACVTTIMIIGVVVLKVISAKLSTGMFWVPDLRFGYPSSWLYELMFAFGIDGRRLYLAIEIFDTFVYSFGYAFVLASLLQWSVNIGHSGNTTRGGIASSFIPKLAWIPWLIDFIENVAHMYCITNFDEGGPDEAWNAAARIGSSSTIIKWSTFGVDLVLIALIAVWKKNKSYNEKLSEDDEEE